MFFKKIFRKDHHAFELKYINQCHFILGQTCKVLNEELEEE